jgi:hypothetical protein
VELQAQGIRRPHSSVLRFLHAAQEIEAFFSFSLKRKGGGKPALCLENSGS